MPLKLKGNNECNEGGIFNKLSTSREKEQKHALPGAHTITVLFRRREGPYFIFILCFVVSNISSFIFSFGFYKRLVRQYRYEFHFV